VNSHDPLCPDALDQIGLDGHCSFCDLISEVRAHEQQRIADDLRAMIKAILARHLTAAPGRVTADMVAAELAALISVVQMIEEGEQ